MGFTAAFGIAGYDLQKDALYLKNWETVKAENMEGRYIHGKAYQGFGGEKLIMFIWRTEQERYERDFCVDHPIRRDEE